MLMRMLFLLVAAAHGQQDIGNLFFNVALLFLESPVDLAPHVRLVCLPPPMYAIAPGTRCFANGWRKNGFAGKGLSSILLKVELPVIEHNACQERLRGTRLGKWFKLHVSFMCAGGEKGVEICKTDGGSPLSCPIESDANRYMQTGIAAWRIGCGDICNPATYTDVRFMRKWIDDTMIVKGYSTTSYTI